MDYDLQVSTLEEQVRNFAELKSSAKELVDECDNLNISGDISNLQAAIQNASEKVENGYNNYDKWIQGYIDELKETETKIASGIEVPGLKGDFSNIFGKILVPALKSNATSDDKAAIANLGLKSTSPYTPEEIQRLLDAANSVPTAGAGWCAAWVSEVYEAAGLGYPGGNACDMYYNWCNSSNLDDLQPGMIIAVSTHPATSAGQTYGHVGIYIGNGRVRHNIGEIEECDLHDWIQRFGSQENGNGTVPAQWGWPV